MMPGELRVDFTDVRRVAADLDALVAEHGGFEGVARRLGIDLEDLLRLAESMAEVGVTRALGDEGEPEIRESLAREFVQIAWRAFALGSAVTSDGFNTKEKDS